MTSFDDREKRDIRMERTIQAKDSKGDHLETSLTTFSKVERQEISSRIQTIMEDQTLNAIVLVDPGNFLYATGVDLPYAEQYPHRQTLVFITRDQTKDAVICLPDWEDVVKDQGWWGAVRVYRFQRDGLYENLLHQLKEHLENHLPDGGNIGIDSDGMVIKFFEEMQSAISGFQFVPVGDHIKELRMVKTDAEIRLLEEACRHSDRAFISAINHSEGNVHDPLNYDLWEFAERIRVHVGEFGGSGTGNVTVLQGEDLGQLYKPPTGLFIGGSFLRTEVTNHHRGYWSNACRTLVVGHPSPDQEKTYQDYSVLKKAAESVLKPGMTCDKVFSVVSDTASLHGIEFLKEAGVGHGVGVDEREAPFLAQKDTTNLQKGMVLVLAIYIQSKEGQWICSKDTYAITEEGYRLLSWYKNWDKLYALVGNSARHG